MRRNDAPSPQDLLGLRRASHEFLRRYAAAAWTFEFGGEGWEIRLPPEVERLPESKRFRVHARQEAGRLADAQLYDVCPETTHRAVGLGAANHEAVVAAGSPAVVASMGIQAPAESGFLRWRGGVGYNALGAPIVACHWGPVAGRGRWLVWWSETRAMTAAYAAGAARTHSARAAHIVSTGVRPIFGPLWYDRQQLLSPHRGSAHETGSAGGDASGPDAGDLVGNSAEVALLCTTLATWRLLSAPDAAVRLSRQPASAAEQAADRAAGLRPRPVTVATTSRSASS